MLLAYVRTYIYVSVAPSFIGVNNIEIQQLHNKNIRITWKVCTYIMYMYD